MSNFTAPGGTAPHAEDRAEPRTNAPDTAHTPGPWQIDTSNDEVEVVAGKYHIAFVGPCVRFSEAEAVANAALIAAAPQLLDAARDLLGLIERELPQFSDMVICDAARAVIAAAIGAGEAK